MPLSSASPVSISSVESTPARQPRRTFSALGRRSDATPSRAGSDDDDSSQARDDRPSNSQEEIQDSFDSNEDLLTNDNSLISDGSDSPLSSLASKTPTPPSSPAITVGHTREQHDEHVYPGRLPLCQCVHWCHCERYRYFSGGLGDTLRHVDEDRQPIESIQPWRVPNQQHLSNTVLDAEILPESSMRSTYTPAYGH